jgi:hypothetical protein
MYEGKVSIFERLGRGKASKISQRPAESEREGQQRTSEDFEVLPGRRRNLVVGGSNGSQRKRLYSMQDENNECRACDS